MQAIYSHLTHIVTFFLHDKCPREGALVPPILYVACSADFYIAFNLCGCGLQFEAALGHFDYTFIHLYWRIRA